MEVFKRINVENYLEKKDGFGDGGRFNKSFKIDYKQEAGLLANQGKIQEKRIKEALEKGREKTIKQANKELKEIIKKGNKSLKKDKREIGKVLKRLRKESISNL